MQTYDAMDSSPSSSNSSGDLGSGVSRVQPHGTYASSCGYCSRDGKTSCSYGGWVEEAPALPLFGALTAFFQVRH